MFIRDDNGKLGLKLIMLNYALVSLNVLSMTCSVVYLSNVVPNFVCLIDLMMEI